MIVSVHLCDLLYLLTKVCGTIPASPGYSLPVLNLQVLILRISVSVFLRDIDLKFSFFLGIYLVCVVD